MQHPVAITGKLRCDHPGCRTLSSASMSWCSSTTTLIMNWLEFGGQKLSKCPDMIGEPRCHPRGSREPLGVNPSQDVLMPDGERKSQTHERPGETVEGLKEHHTAAHLRGIITEARALA